MGIGDVFGKIKKIITRKKDDEEWTDSSFSDISYDTGINNYTYNQPLHQQYGQQRFLDQQLPNPHLFLPPNFGYMNQPFDQTQIQTLFMQMQVINSKIDMLSSKIDHLAAKIALIESYLTRFK